MEDHEIIGLFWQRSETAIRETATKYGRYLRYIAMHILRSAEDSEECVSDTYLRAWNAMPPQRPRALKAYLGRIARNLSLDRYERMDARKRGGGEMTLVLEELCEALPGGEGGDALDDLALRDAISRFLRTLSAEKRVIFVRRYWYLCPVKEIAGDLGLSESKVKSVLMRVRRALREALEREGISV